jgi:hypothetical protein
MRRKRVSQLKTKGKERIDEHEELYLERTAAVEDVGDHAECPIKNCTAILTQYYRVFNKRLKIMICVRCNARNGNPRINPKVPRPAHIMVQKHEGLLVRLEARLWMGL